MKQDLKEQTEVKVHLSITHFECFPDEITQILGITPTRTWQRGTPIPKSKGGVRKVNGWSLESPLDSTRSPEEQVDAILNKVMPNAERFEKLPPKCELNLSCAIYAYDDSQRVFSFSSEAVKALAAIGAPISIAYYDFTSLPEEKPGKPEAE